jgi:hypothetical protein
MNSSQCRVTRQEIEQSELHQRLGAETLLHLESCQPCREFQLERARLRELIGSLEPVAAPGDFEIRLRARIAADRKQSARASFFNRFVVSTPAIAVAALIVMSTGGIVWLAQHQRNQESASASKAPPRAGQVGSTVSTTNDKPLESNFYQTAPANNPPVVLTAQGPKGRNPYRDLSDKSSGGREAIGRATDFSITGAESIRQGEQRTGDVSLSAPVKPLVVSLEDNSGTKRRISLPPVSFGSQRLVDNRLAGSKTNSRSW